MAMGHPTSVPPADLLLHPNSEGWVLFFLGGRCWFVFLVVFFFPSPPQHPKVGHNLVEDVPAHERAIALDKL